MSNRLATNNLKMGIFKYNIINKTFDDATSMFKMSCIFQ